MDLYICHELLSFRQSKVCDGSDAYRGVGRLCTVSIKNKQCLQLCAACRLLVNGHANLGPTELTQYFIRNTRLFKMKLSTNENAIVMEVVLGRRLLGNFLTIFIPTFLLNVIGHSTNFFKSFFFEAVVTVNLTVLLVLVTMFISVSNSLPTTSYVKMVDLWLIFTLLLPFVEVLIHTYKVFHHSLCSFTKVLH